MASMSERKLLISNEKSGATDLNLGPTDYEGGRLSY